jgi:outer membrane protein assembly factor BamA
MRKICFIFVLYILSSHLSAQDPVQFPIRIETVVVVGNEKTREEVIMREIPHQFPDTLDLQDLQYIQNRITNLLLFNQVELALVGEPGHTILLIQVTEFWYIYPVPLLFINERSWKKISYGFQLSHKNFRGMNERLSLGGWLGYNPAFFLRYFSPWLGKNAKMILGFNFFGRKVGNKFYDFDEGHLGGGLTLGKRLSLHNLLQATFELKRITMPEEFQDLSVSGSGTDLVPKFSLQYINDHRDLVEYPKRGYYIMWRATRAGLTDKQPNFWRFNFDHRLYFKLHPRVSIGGRNSLTLNRGELPIYDRVFIGFGERVRGYFKRVLTAQNLMMQNYEMRINLLPIRYLSWQDAPYLSAFFQGLKYGLSMGIFMDSGIVWDHTNQIAMKNFFTGYGVGLHIHLPYVHVFRIDRAWNDKGRGEWIIEVGVVF